MINVFFQRSRRLFTRLFFGLKFLKLQRISWTRFFCFSILVFWNRWFMQLKILPFGDWDQKFSNSFFQRSRRLFTRFQKFLQFLKLQRNTWNRFSCFSILVFSKQRTSPLKFMSFQFVHEKSGLTPIVRMIFSSHNCHLDHEQHKDITKTPTGWSYECLRVRNASKTNYYHLKTGFRVQNPNVENCQDLSKRSKGGTVKKF